MDDIGLVARLSALGLDDTSVAEYVQGILDADNDDSDVEEGLVEFLTAAAEDVSEPEKISKLVQECIAAKRQRSTPFAVAEATGGAELCGLLRTADEPDEEVPRMLTQEELADIEERCCSWISHAVR